MLPKQYNPEFKFRLVIRGEVSLKGIRLVFHYPCPGKAGTVWGLVRGRRVPYRERLTEQGPRFGSPGRSAALAC